MIQIISTTLSSRFSLSVFCLALGTTLINTPFCFAEYSCTSTVEYKWAPQKKEKTPTAGSPATTTDSSPGDPVSVFWGSFTQRGALEEDAKKALLTETNKQKTKAEAECRDLHENQSNCLVQKYAAAQSAMSALTFTQRKELESSFASDCARATGTCLGSNVSEPTCSEQKAPEPAADAAAPAAAGKDAKKKK